MAIKIYSATFTGIQGVIVHVEVDISAGLPNFNIVGLADTAVKESKERVRAAILNSGYEFPVGRITVNLAPADVRKEGGLFDLPIAIGILIASQQIKGDSIEEFVLMGELSLNGELREIKGVLSIALESLNHGIKNMIIPLCNRKECISLNNINVYPFENLNEVIHFLSYKDSLPYREKVELTKGLLQPDFKEIVGQESTKRALEIAAAGSHNVLLMGPPGSGKSMLASRMSSILPELSYEEALEVTKIYSVSGYLDKEKGVINTPPYRNPHHTISQIALIGGGNNLRIGEISLAHNGILFLDEILEFKKNVLEVLRQPLEERIINITRATGSVVYPANFMLIGALNPCPCGFYLSNSATKACSCTETERKRYLSRLSGPLLDRIDIFSFVPQLKYDELTKDTKRESSEEIQARVKRARAIQKERFSSCGFNIRYNSEMNKDLIDKYCNLDEKCKSIVEKVYKSYGLSTRAYYRILKVSRTIADLNERKNIDSADLIEAIQYRKFLKEII